MQRSVHLKSYYADTIAQQGLGIIQFLHFTVKKQFYYFIMHISHKIEKV
jgi:hypothetical protein